MAGMAIAIPGVLNISETGDTMGKIRQKIVENGQKTITNGQKTGVSTFAIPVKVGQCRPWYLTLVDIRGDTFSKKNRSRVVKK